MDSTREVLVCQYVNCQGNGSAEVLKAFQSNPVPSVTVNPSECQGQCNMGPTVRVLPDGTWYCRVKPKDVPTIVEQHLKQGKPVERLLHPRMHPKFG
ncbi:MAG: (2Fe-2S) ferredoxin domain-containing protein [Leptolyngbyaceae cyanobacterium HOT.MB2.61]|nr:(2Fe-2S) ferredoxin domain-containing protein [Leptolyngbyaceae cyanobacterium HOT.MB2.61]